jgi:predicted CopG family antitoxin
MGYNKHRFRQVMLHVDIYNYLQAQKRPNESFNDVLRRILFKKKYEEIDKIKPKVKIDNEIKPRVKIDEGDELNVKPRREEE